jgi:hypothetical protein
MSNVNIPKPEQQIDFSFALDQIRCLYMQDALSKTVEEIDLTTLDKELSEYVPQICLKALAKTWFEGRVGVSCSLFT